MPSLAMLAERAAEVKGDDEEASNRIPKDGTVLSRGINWKDKVSYLINPEHDPRLEKSETRLEKEFSKRCWKGFTGKSLSAKKQGNELKQLVSEKLLEGILQSDLYLYVSSSNRNSLLNPIST